MTFYLYVTSRGAKGRFLAATITERRAISAVVVALKGTYPKQDEWETIEVYENHPAQSSGPIHVFQIDV